MLDPALIRENPDWVRKAVRDKNEKADVDALAVVQIPFVDLVALLVPLLQHLVAGFQFALPEFGFQAFIGLGRLVNLDLC